LPEILSPSSTILSEPSGHGEIILLVDDNESLRKAVTALLEMNGYRVLEAPNGNEALEVSRHYSGSIDLLVTDVIMPEMSGRVLAELLSGERPGLKVLFMSGYTDEVIHRHGQLDANSAFVSKPVTMHALLLKIRELIGKVAEKDDPKIPETPA
jgi:DNA-binding response OmpR family regulator